MTRSRIINLILEGLENRKLRNLMTYIDLPKMLTNCQGMKWAMYGDVMITMIACLCVCMSPFCAAVPALKTHKSGQWMQNFTLCTKNFGTTRWSLEMWGAAPSLQSMFLRKLHHTSAFISPNHVPLITNRKILYLKPALIASQDAIASRPEEVSLLQEKST